MVKIIKSKGLTKRGGGSEKERDTERGKWSVRKRKKEGKKTQGRKVRVPTGGRG